MRRGLDHASASRGIFWLVTALLAGPVLATDQVIEDVRMSRSGDTATAEVVLGCAMRYIDHSPRRGGAVLAIRLSLSPGCRRLLGGVRSEMRNPRTGHLGHVQNVEFELLGLDEATLTMRFDRPVGFAVSQGGIGNLIRVDVDAGTQVEPEPPSMAADLPITPKPPAIPDRTPMRLRRVTPATDNAYFVLSLATLPPTAAVDLSPFVGMKSVTPYIRQTTVGERSWQELRVGFFATEAEARTALGGIPGDWPQAWVAIATADERADARAGTLPGPAVTNSQPGLGLAASVASGDAQGLSPEATTELMAQARTALIDRDYDRSVRIYTEVLKTADVSQRADAREYLGLARERKGQFAHAKAEYEAFLAEFPDGPRAARVQQRLAGLLGMAEASRREQLRPVSQRESTPWEVYGGISQFYRRDVNQFHEEDQETVNQSAFISRADLVAQRRGRRFDLVGRMNSAYYYDMLDDDGPGDQGLVSYAYLDIVDNQSGVAARVGRQTRYSGGVLGRFDGAHISYAWKPDLTINVTTGFPVDSPRYSTETDHVFYGASVDLTNVADVWDFSVFTNLARVDGISDREAIGAEARFVTERWNLVSLVDFDVSYSVLNSAMFIGNWRAHDRLTINGRFDIGARPFLTTRNALIGQPVASVDELRNLYSESEIRRLARNRTSEAYSGSFGFSASIGERFYWNTDVSYGEIDDTVASAGVAALPATGAQYFLTSNLVGSSLLKPGDTGVFGLRHNVTRTSDTTTVIADFRYPATDGLRVNPRIAMSYRQRDTDGTDEWVASPMLRLIYQWRRRYRLEFEAGGHWSTSDVSLQPDPSFAIDDTEDTSAYFLNLGYMVDF